MIRPTRSLGFAALFALTTLTAGLAWAHGDEEHADEEHAESFVGEVLDLACYMQHPEDGQGPEHAKCAEQCINKGLAAGLKVGDKVYLLLGKGHDPIKAKLAPLAGKQAMITGEHVMSGGMDAIVMTGAMLAKDHH